jgi:hypothetical protein
MLSNPVSLLRIECGISNRGDECDPHICCCMDFHRHYRAVRLGLKSEEDITIPNRRLKAEEVETG